MCPFAGYQKVTANDEGEQGARGLPVLEALSASTGLAFLEEQFGACSVVRAPSCVCEMETWHDVQRGLSTEQSGMGR